MPVAEAPKAPSKFYRSGLWLAGLRVVRLLPEAVSAGLCRLGALIYWHTAPQRRAVVIENLLPVVGGDPARAGLLARRLFTQFTLKLADLWRFEAGVDTAGRFTDLSSTLRNDYREAQINPPVEDARFEPPIEPGYQVSRP